jgi:hypothetical protein
LLGRTISCLLTTIALLLVLAICRLLTVSVLLLVRILVRRDLLVLLRRWVGRVAAVWIIALVILTLRRCVVALLPGMGSVWGQLLLQVRMRQRRKGIPTCP